MLKCPICGFKAKSEGGLKTHLRSHDNEPSSLEGKWEDVRRAAAEDGLSGEKVGFFDNVEDVLKEKELI